MATDKKKEDEMVEGLEPVAPDLLADFVQAMNQEVIPKIVEVVEKRRMQAAESRLKQLKC